jgi:replicative DNA helicase
LIYSKHTELIPYWQLLSSRPILFDKDKRFLIVFVTMEESTEAIAEKLIASLLGIRRSDLLNMDEVEISKQLAGILHPKVAIKVIYLPSLSKLSDIELTVTKMEASNFEPILVVVDYLDKVQPPISTNEFRHGLLYVTYGLREIAIRHNCSVVSATQLNRESLKEKQGSVDLDKIAEAFAKAWEADSVILFKQSNVDTTTNIATLDMVLAKSRHAMRGLHKRLLFDLASLSIVGEAADGTPNQTHQTIDVEDSLL